MIYSYKESCMEEIMDNLGYMIEFAVYELKLEANKFLNLFLNSGIAREIEQGNPKYIVGMSGAELAYEVLYKSYGEYMEMKEYYRFEKSVEYWGMWSLAYFQNYSRIPFEDLLEYVDFHTIMQWYSTLHEADISKFTSRMEVEIEHYRNTQETTLARLRRIQGYSQQLLARESGVSLRMIQLYEQKQNDISKAQAETLLRLARTLGCSMETLLD